MNNENSVSSDDCVFVQNVNENKRKCNFFLGFMKIVYKGKSHSTTLVDQASIQSSIVFHFNINKVVSHV